MELLALIKSQSLPLAVFFLLFIGELWFIFLYGYNKYCCSHKNGGLFDCPLENIPQLFYKLPFLFLLIANVILSYFIWDSCSNVNPLKPFYSTGSALSPFIRIDPFCAGTVVLMEFTGFIVGLCCMLDKKNVITVTKITWFILACAGIHGIIYFYNLFSICFFMIITQVAVSGLLYNYKIKNNRNVSNINYYISRVTLLVLFFVGVLLLRIKYGTDNIALLAQQVSSDTLTLIAFILLVLPMLYIFIKPSPCPNAASGCVFLIRTQVSLFVLFRIIFSLYGPMSGLEKIPAIFMILGMVLLVLSLTGGKGINDAENFCSSMQFFMKGMILFAVGLSYTGVFTAENAAMYGISSMESTIWLWIIFLPVSTCLAIITSFLNENFNGKISVVKLHGAKIPLIIFTIFLIICIQAGLPPFTGYSAKQLLLRSASYLNPFVFALLFLANLLMLANGIKFILKFILPQKSNQVNEYDTVKNVRKLDIAIPLSVIIMLFFYMTAFPGQIFEKLIAPSAASLINRLPYGYIELENKELGNNENIPSQDIEDNEYDNEELDDKEDNQQ